MNLVLSFWPLVRKILISSCPRGGPVTFMLREDGFSLLASRRVLAGPLSPCYIVWPLRCCHRGVFTFFAKRVSFLEKCMAFPVKFFVCLISFMTLPPISLRGRSWFAISCSLPWQSRPIVLRIADQSMTVNWFGLNRNPNQISLSYKNSVRFWIRYLELNLIRLGWVSLPEPNWIELYA